LDQDTFKHNQGSITATQINSYLEINSEVLSFRF